MGKFQHFQLSQKDLKRIKDIRKFAPHCVHGHTLLSHPNCFPKETKDQIAFLDIETFSRDADWGEILCWVIADEDGHKMFDCRKGNSDFSVVHSCLVTLSSFDVIVGHYSRRFDMPYVVTRALYHGLDVPPRNTWKQIDLWRFCKDKLSLARNSQVALSLLLRQKSKKSWVDGYAWSNAAFRGDKKALQQILNHCKVDVEELRNNYMAIKHLLGRATV